MPFDSKSIDLEGRWMIEASAGTGKTFSIAILFLRIIIENPRTLVKSILVVTFTNSAVAELEIRIRKFIREAYAYVKGGQQAEAEAEPEIRLLLEGYRNNKENLTWDMIRERLENAVHSLDELNVRTIHSFCQETLKEFSFETKSIFNSEIITDETEILEFIINEFWRKEIYALEPGELEDLLDFFDKKNGSRASKLRRLLTDALACRLDNKEFICTGKTGEESKIKELLDSFRTRKSEIYSQYMGVVRQNEGSIRDAAGKLKKNCSFTIKDDDDIDQIAKKYYAELKVPGYVRICLSELIRKYIDVKYGLITAADFGTYVTENADELKKMAGDEKFALDFVDELIDSPDRIQTLDKKFAADYIRNLFPDVYPAAIKMMNDECLLTTEMRPPVLNLLLCTLLDNEGAYYPMAASIKKARNCTGYDDMISNVHDSIERVKDVLLKKYSVLFIDEFQDTDKYQYKIFDTVFENMRVFFIGDPKQSIYGWRKADLNTYKEAKEKIREANPLFVAGMMKNFRSTPRMLGALDVFFSSVENMFIDEAIQYYTVEPGKPDMAEMKRNNEDVVPVTIIEHDEKSIEELTGKKPRKEDYCRSITDFVAAETERLLFSGEYTIDGRPVCKSDIGVLVRTRAEAADIKAALTGKNIQAITLDDTQILKTKEAGELYFVMAAVNRPSKKSINRALLNSNFGFNTAKLSKVRDEEILNEFDRLRQVWKKDGVYAMLSSFIDSFNIRGICTDEENRGGLRALSNYYQLMEILHDLETAGRRKEEDLIAVFSKSMNSATSNDENVQRLESDENAVKIVTIHKAKGLEYKIVFAPFLDLNAWTRELVEFRDKATGKYFFALNDNGVYQQKNLDAVRQENRRLIYVALTRAIYKCYINVNCYPKFGESSLKPFFRELKNSAEQNHNNGLVEIRNISPGDPVNRTGHNEGLQLIQPRSAEGIEEFIKTWDIHSFSSLSHKHEPTTCEPAEITDPYDRFAFDGLPKGAKAGLFLHSIFERLEFDNPDGYQACIDKAGEYYSTVYSPEHSQHYLDLVKHCMNVPIRDKEGKDVLCLGEIGQPEKLPELEFWFSIDRHRKSRILSIIDDVEFSTDPDIEGLMHGFIDLLFRHRGRFYILDWKSNFLGNKISDYEEPGIRNAMKNNNYHLQYYIYTIAVKRWLEKKIPGFDYERDFGGVIYLFLRGVRKDNPATGIFFDKPGAGKVKKLDELFKNT